jgi:hypothetical protein
MKPTRPYVFDNILPRAYSKVKSDKGRQVAQLGIETVEVLDSLDQLHEQHIIDEILPKGCYENRDDMGM